MPQSKTLIFRGCARCKGPMEQIYADPRYPEINTIASCLKCGFEDYQVKDYYRSLNYDAQFKELRLKTWTKGRKKYRGNRQEGFVGNPFILAQKNLANLANLVEVISHLFPDLQASCTSYIDVLNSVYSWLYKAEADKRVKVIPATYNAEINELDPDLITTKPSVKTNGKNSTNGKNGKHS